jgi:hypothetical protein
MTTISFLCKKCEEVSSIEEEEVFCDPIYVEKIYCFKCPICENKIQIWKGILLKETIDRLSKE